MSELSAEASRGWALGCSLCLRPPDSAARGRRESWAVWGGGERREEEFCWRYKSIGLCDCIPAKHLPAELEAKGMLGLTSCIARSSRQAGAGAAH